MTALPSLSRDQRANLVRAALDQLDHEEALLDASLATLQRLRQAILNHEQTELREVLRHQSADMSLRETVHSQRDAFRRAAAHSLGGNPDAISMGFLIQQWPGDDTAALAKRRERLLQKTREAERLNRETTALIHHHLGFVRRLLADFFGNVPSVAYGPLANAQDATCGRLFEAQG